MENIDKEFNLQSTFDMDTEDFFQTQDIFKSITAHTSVA